MYFSRSHWQILNPADFQHKKQSFADLSKNIYMHISTCQKLVLLMSYKIEEKNPSSRIFRLNALYSEEKMRFILNI